VPPKTNITASPPRRDSAAEWPARGDGAALVASVS